MGGPRRAKSDPRRPQEPPRAPQEPSKELREAPSETPWAPEAAQKPPGSNFGAILEGFWSIFRIIIRFRGLICPGFRAHVSDMFASFAHRFPCALCSAVRLLSASLGGRTVPQEPPETAQGDTTDRTAQKTTGQHKTEERQRNIAQPSAAQNDSREPRSTAWDRRFNTHALPVPAPGQVYKFGAFSCGRRRFSLLGVSWRLLARFWVPLGASAARFEAPGLPRRPPASILGAIFGAFLRILEGFSHGFLHSFFDEFSGCFFRMVSHGFCCFFRSARKRPTRLKHCKNQWLFMIFLGTRLRRRSGEGEGKRQKTT